MDLLTTIQLALVDAINPCSIAIQSLLLAMLLTKGRRAALIGGLLFAFTILVMYALYGLLLHTVLALYYEYVKWLLMALLAILATLEIYAYINYQPGAISVEMPKVLRPYARKLLSQVYSPWLAVPVAVLVSLFLLPCSSGPYVVFLGLQKQIEWLYFIIYLLVFASPFFIITLLVYVGTNPQKIRDWRNKHVRELHLISGLLLLAVLVYLIL